MRFTVSFLLAVLLASLAQAEDVSSLIEIVHNEKNWPRPGRERFRQGVEDWNAGRYLRARNNWIRAQGWMERSGAQVPARDAMASLSAQADRLSRPAEPTVEVEPVPGRTPLPAKKRVRRRASPLPAPLNAASVLDSARVAREAGQVEKALRLMRIASGLPGGEGALAEADALERELLQPAR